MKPYMLDKPLGPESGP